MKTPKPWREMCMIAVLAKAVQEQQAGNRRPKNEASMTALASPTLLVA